MKIKREELYETLRKECPGKYSVGLHGISLQRAQTFYDIDISDKKQASEFIANKIVKEGLRIKSARSVNGTVAFCGRLDDRESIDKTFKGLTYYTYGPDLDYIIVAPPIEFECTDGRTLYAGATNLESEYKRNFGTTGYEISTILDRVILTIRSTIEPKYILGRFKILEGGEIDLQINPAHISKQGKLSSHEFDELISALYMDMDDDFIEALLSKDFKKLEPLMHKLSSYPGPRTRAHLLETYKQMLRENSIQDLTPDDLTKLQQLKEKFKKAVAQEKHAKTTVQNRIAAMANYSDQEVIDFATTTHYTQFQNFPPTIKNNVELIRKVTQIPGLNSLILYYFGSDVKNDPEAMINLANNCDTETFVYYLRDDWQHKAPSTDKSDLGYEPIGPDVRMNPIFWETLNTRILEINKDKNLKYPYFDVEKEIRLATETKKLTQKKS